MDYVIQNWEICSYLSRIHIEIPPIRHFLNSSLVDSITNLTYCFGHDTSSILPDLYPSKSTQPLIPTITLSLDIF